MTQKCNGYQLTAVECYEVWLQHQLNLSEQVHCEEVKLTDWLKNELTL